MNRKLQWCVINGFAAAMLALALQGSSGAQNVVLALVWACSLPSIAGACIKEVADKIREKGRAVPALLMRSYDVGFFVGLAWMGWIYTAIAWALMSLAVESVYSEAKA